MLQYVEGKKLVINRNFKEDLEKIYKKVIEGLILEDIIATKEK